MANNNSREDKKISFLEGGVMMKTKIPSMSYNSMFKAVFSNNKVILSKLVQAILEYYKIDIDIKDKELIIRNNELPLDNYMDKQLICDYIIKINDTTDLNIEINRSKYIGLTERNLTYSFKIFYEHFKSGDTYNEFNKYTFLQVNFNNFSNINGKAINRYYMIDIDDITNKLSNNFSIMNIDIEKCFDIVYNNDNLEGISNLEKWSGIIACNYLEDISTILESGLLSMEEKDKFLRDIKEKSRDKDILEGIKFEDSMEYRFKLVEDDAFERGVEQGIERGKVEGIEENKATMIKSMLDNKLDYEIISKVSGKSIKEIKEIEKSMK